MLVLSSILDYPLVVNGIELLAIWENASHPKTLKEMQRRMRRHTFILVNQNWVYYLTDSCTDEARHHSNEEEGLPSQSEC